MLVEEKIRELAETYSKRLKSVVDARVVEMQDDDVSNLLVYRVLGVSDAEGRLIDTYQNKGRFLYKYAGSFLESAAKLCFLEKFQKALETLYKGVGGAYYFGDRAWQYVRKRTGVDLLQILKKQADENA